MHIIRITDIVPGTGVLGRPIFAADGSVLYPPGQPVNQELLAELQDRQIDILVAEDEATREVRLEEFLPSGLWIDWVLQAREIYRGFRTGSLCITAVELLLEDMRRFLKGRRWAIPLPSRSVPGELQLYAHAVNVALWTCRIADQMPYKQDAMMPLMIGALLHDIGKERTSHYREHPALAYEQLSHRADIPPLSALIVYQHHEVLSGAGYPQGLRGGEVVEQAQVCGIANLFDKFSEACVSMYMEAADIIEALQSSFYAVTVVAAARRAFPRFLPGSTLRVHNSEPALVLSLAQADEPILRFVHTGRVVIAGRSQTFEYLKP